MKTVSPVSEYCPDTGLIVAYLPDFPGMHSQAETLEEPKQNLRELTGELDVVVDWNAISAPNPDALARLEKGFHLGGQPMARSLVNER